MNTGDGLDFDDDEFDLHSDSSNPLLGSLYEESLDDLNPEVIHPLFLDIQNKQHRYLIKDQLGHGAMKIVSRTHDHHADRDVAFAALKDEFGPDSFDSFLREARLTARLEHPNIIKIIDVGILNQRPFFAMELKPGQTLKNILTSAPKEETEDPQSQPLEKQLEIFLKICDAVAYAHSRGVIHLDLKPDNIQVGSFGEVLVCDWGLGKVISNDESNTDHQDDQLGILELDPNLFNDMTLLGTIQGTPGYMAPEQIEEDGEVGIHTDIYALGAILYSILTHEASYLGSTREVLQQTCKGKLMAPSLRSREKISDGLDAVVSKAMALAPHKRYPNVLRLRTDVDNFLSGYATKAENAGFLRLASLMYQRNRAISQLAAVGMITLIISITLFMIKIKQSEGRAIEQRIEAVRQHKNAEHQMRIAQKERQAAINHQRVATEVKSLYSIQKKISRNLNRDESLADLKQGIHNISHRLNLNHPTIKDFHALRKSIDDTINRSGLSKEIKLNNIKLKGTLSFIMQDFELTHACIEQGWSAPSLMAETSSLFLSKPQLRSKESQENGLKVEPSVLPIEQLLELVTEILKTSDRDHVPLKYRLLSNDLETTLMIKLSVLMVLYDGLMRENLTDHGLLVKKILEAHNPEWCQQEFDYDAISQQLRIGGKGMDHLESAHFGFLRPNLLQSLPIESLTLKVFPNHVIDQLSRLPIQDLNISDAYVLNHNSIKRITSLTSLSLREKQLSKNELKSLSKTIKINLLPVSIHR